MLGVTLKDIKIQDKNNCGGKCLLCKQRNIFYSVLDGSFVYYCLTCKKWLNVYDVK